jgi:hypothetical protein
MHVSLKGLANNTVLSGAISGKLLLGQLLASVEEPREPTPLFLDFAGVEVATASFLRESVVRFRDLMRGKRSTLYPVVANADESILEELSVLMGADGDAMMCCRLDDKGHVTGATLIGSLDPKQRLTFDLVNHLGETDAGTLMREHSKDEVIKQTAWNNRLAMLASLGLVVELPQGRAKRYRPLFAEKADGH